MYETFMERARNSDAPITSKSQAEDEVEVLQYIAFAYLDWARQAEASNNAKSAPADDRYRKSILYIERALKKTRKENYPLKYNWCMAKLAAANCVLQKLKRNIRRTAQEVKDALDGLQESLPKVQAMIQSKQEGKKVPVPTSLMNNFVTQCKANIESAKSHLSEEIKKEAEANEEREIQQMAAMAKQKERELAELEEKERIAKQQERIEEKARMKMEKVSSLLEGWEYDALKARQEAEARKNKKNAPKNNAPQAEDDDDVKNLNDKLFDESSDEEDNKDNAEEDPLDKAEAAIQNKNLFGDSDDDDDDDEGAKKAEPEKAPVTPKDLFGDSDDDDDDDGKDAAAKKDDSEAPKPAPTGQDLFGDDSSSDEELVPAKNKREKDDDGDEDEAPSKKRKVEEEEEQ
jgi:RNA polymerase-associated protein CTR9